MTEPKASILAVDDTPQNLDILVSLLKEDYRVRVATHGKIALKLAAKEQPDLILLDIMMPDMDGFEVCRRLKEMDGFADVPIIFISALDQASDKVKAFTNGGVDYITKPFQAEEVEARVATHLALRSQTRKLRESYDRLSELESLRDSLVHMVVHDMRSPLIGMSGCLQMLHADTADTLGEEQVEDLETAMAAAETLRDMVTSLLDVSRLEAGEMPLQVETCDARTVVSDALSSLGALSKGRRLRFEPSGEPVPMCCDTEVTRRIVGNLVANALKFTPASGEVGVRAVQSGDRARIEVTDTGPGIPPDYRDRIFEKFGQVDAREEGRKFSTGLGLTFCKLAVEAHGGTIGVDSEEGVGSTFWFALPMEEAGVSGADSADHAPT